MVFRRENKVDAFQRQMSALRHQIGGEAGEGRDEMNQEMPELEDDRFPSDTYDDRGQYEAQDAGGYSFGTYPSAPPAQADVEPQDMAPAVPEMPMVDSQISVVAQDTFWKGDVESDGSLHVYGRVEGNLNAKEDVWLAEGADVQATITARRVIVAGRVSGTINASSRFEALPQGKIDADVNAPSFVVHEGAAINGQLTMAAGEGNGQGRADRSGSPAIIQRRARSGA
ncbi:MAG TPA: polymer-forming cytoskeletal protein [Thermomicrobiales bacterium]|nr:polymer-forming cytoskeletal protein [Thermomicrobiales bacterium]